jgi:hypothetical protein
MFMCTVCNVLHTVNVYTVYLLTQGRGGGVVVNQRERVGQHGRVQITSWVENTIMTEWTHEIESLSPVYKL